MQQPLTMWPDGTRTQFETADGTFGPGQIRACELFAGSMVSRNLPHKLWQNLNQRNPQDVAISLPIADCLQAEFRFPQPR